MTGSFPFSVIPVLDTGIQYSKQPHYGCRIECGMTVYGFELFLPVSRRESGDTIGSMYYYLQSVFSNSHELFRL